YGYRVDGPWDPARGLRCNPAKLLLDPYAKAISGTVTFGPEVLGQDETHPDAPSTLDSAGHVPRSLVEDPAFAWQGHQAAIAYLKDLGVTTVELLPVHQNVPESFLVQEGLTNYWGYNTIGFFAPHNGYSAAVRDGRPGGQVAEFQ